MRPHATSSLRATGNSIEADPIESAKSNLFDTSSWREFCDVTLTLKQGHRADSGAEFLGAVSIVDRHQQTIDVGRGPTTIRCHSQRRTSGWRRSRTPQVDLARSSLSTGSRFAKRAMP